MPSPSEHCDDVNLALVAAGGSAPSAVFARHMASCTVCSDRYDDYHDVVDVAVASLEDRAYSQPPGKVWRAISDGAGEAGSQPDLVIEGMPARLRRPVAVPEGEKKPKADGDRTGLVLAIVISIVILVMAMMVGLVVMAG